MYNKPMTFYKSKKIIFILALISIFILIVVIFISSKKRVNPSPTPSPSTSYLPPSEEKTFQLLKILPIPPVYKSLWPEERVTLEFNSPIDQNSISYSIKPSVNTKIIYEDKNPNAFSIIPTTSTWQTNVDYTFLVSKNLKSISGQTLKEDIIFTLRREKSSSDEIAPLKEHL